MMDKKPDPDSESAAYQAMEPYWKRVKAILGGQDAIKAGGVTFLPRFPDEDADEYNFRLSVARFTNIFGDIVDTLAAKPFAQEVTIEGATPEEEAFIENVDGMGGHLHVFAGDLMHSAIAYSIEWLLIDYTRLAVTPRTIAEQKAAGGRPYWVRIPATRVKAVYSEMIGGQEVITHFRFEEYATVRDGFEEKQVERVRILNREVILNEAGEAVQAAAPTWELWEEQKDKATGVKKWVQIVEATPLSIDTIPVVPIIMGKRKGSTWQITPPLQSAADLQITHYQQESDLEYAKKLTAFPMLAGNGVTPPVDAEGKPVRVPVGPKTILFAPMDGDGNHGEWNFIEPNATSLRFLADEADGTEQQLRELGRQPLTAKAGNITTVAAAYAGDKAMTVIKAWAINLKDALEQAFMITGKYLGTESRAEVQINIDSLNDLTGDNGASTLIEARKNGDLSQATLWGELKRRGILSPNFDGEAEAQTIIDEMPGDPSPDQIEGAMLTMTAQ